MRTVDLDQLERMALALARCAGRIRHGAVFFRENPTSAEAWQTELQRLQERIDEAKRIAQELETEIKK